MDAQQIIDECEYVKTYEDNEIEEYKKVDWKELKRKVEADKMITYSLCFLFMILLWLSLAILR